MDEESSKQAIERAKAEAFAFYSDILESNFDNPPAELVNSLEYLQ